MLCLQGLQTMVPLNLDSHCVGSQSWTVTVTENHGVKWLILDSSRTKNKINCNKNYPGKRPQTVCLRTCRAKSRWEKQKRKHASSGFFRCGHGTELCSRSFYSQRGASVWVAVRDAAAAAGQLAAAAEGQTVAGLSRCRGHGSGCVRSIRFCQAGMHSVPGRGLVRWPNAAARVLLNVCAPATTSSPASRGLLARPQDIYKRYLGRISLWDLCTSSL